LAYWAKLLCVSSKTPKKNNNNMSAEENKTQTFKLAVATGYSSRLPRTWGDTKKWTIDVSPTDTLADVLTKITAAGGHGLPPLSSFLVAAGAHVSLEHDHGRLPDPRPEATVGANGLNANTVLRWPNGMAMSD
jgi:hypothetical protein